VNSFRLEPRSAVAALRPKQWLKNGVLLAPLLFAKDVFAQGQAIKALMATASFCFLASVVYIFNDWIDRDKDRQHPEKCNRPIASGKLSGSGAVVVALLCLLLSAALVWPLPWLFVEVSVGYLMLQVLYTFWLKHLVLIDVMTIAMGFILRVVAGAVAISVTVSNWLFLCTLLLAVFLGFAKRRAELGLESASSHRQNLAEYTLPLVDQLIGISAATCILAYGLYTVSKETIEHVGSDRLKFTVPVVIYGVFRYLFLVHKRGQGGAPERVLLGDRPLLITVAGFLALSGWALYGG
jgi:4-hydroxybenzoate polyprenyltransferase